MTTESVLIKKLPEPILKHVRIPAPDYRSAIRQQHDRLNALEQEIHECHGVESNHKEVLVREVTRVRRLLLLNRFYERGDRWPLLHHEQAFSLRGATGKPLFGLFSIKSPSLFIEVYKQRGDWPWKWTVSHRTEDSYKDPAIIAYSKQIYDLFKSMQDIAIEKNSSYASFVAQFRGAIPHPIRQKIAFMPVGWTKLNHSRFDGAYLLADLDWSTQITITGPLFTNTDPLLLGYSKWADAFYIIDVFDVTKSEDMIRLEFAENP